MWGGEGGTGHEKEQGMKELGGEGTKRDGYLWEERAHGGGGQGEEGKTARGKKGGRAEDK